MDNVQFTNEWRPPRFEPQTPKMVSVLMKYSGGLIKNEKQATYVLIGFVVVLSAISLFLVFGGSGPQLPPQEEILRDTPNTPTSL